MNEKQIKAIEEMDNVLLIAGAGTGKTTTIINKIDYLIKNNKYKQDEILVISFTNESVNDIKKKINYNVDIKTFHKLAIDLINNDNYHIANDYYLNFIIDEYFKSYAKYNIKTKLSLRRIALENTKENVKQLIIKFINLYKANYNNIDYIINLFKNSHFVDKDYLRIIIEIYLIYYRDLESSGLLDFNDLIIKATNLIKNNEIKTKYKIIIIDEFQDTSLNRFNLILALLKQNDGKLFAVGDDYQSIYRFSGCNLDLFLNLEKYLNIKIIKLDVNYRNNQETMLITNDFIMKNKKQLSKNTICLKHINKSIVICFYVNKRKVINKLTNSINGNILILGRNNKDKELFNVTESETIRYLTIHKAKGLEEDNVIIINLENINNSLPSKIKNNKLIDKIINKDLYPYEEERRLFYVALTRSRNKTYLVVPNNNYSVFIKELLNNYINYIEIIKL